MAKKREELISYIRHLQELEARKVSRNRLMLCVACAALVVVAWRTLTEFDRELMLQGMEILMTASRLLVLTVLVRLLLIPAGANGMGRQMRRIQDDTTAGAFLKIAYTLLLPACLSVALLSFEFSNTLLLLIALLSLALVVLLHLGQRKGYPLPPLIESLGRPIARAILFLLIGIAIILEVRALLGPLGEPAPLINYVVPFNLALTFWLLLLVFENARPRTASIYLQQLEQGLTLLGHDEEETQRKVEVHLLGPGLSGAVGVKWKQMENLREKINEELQDAGARIAEIVDHAEEYDTAEVEEKVQDIASTASAWCKQPYDEMCKLGDDLRRVFSPRVPDSVKAGIFEALAGRVDRFLEETRNAIDALPKYFKETYQKGADSGGESLF